MKKRIVTILTASMLVLGGCGAPEENTGDLGSPTPLVGDTQQSEASKQELGAAALSFPKIDYPEKLEEAVTLVDKEDMVITQSGTYRLTGDYQTSPLIVNVDKDKDNGTVYLVLNHVNMTQSSQAPIHILGAEEVVVVLEGENVITQGNETANEEDAPSAALYSEVDMTIVGEGHLTLSTGYKDGICSKKTLVIEGGQVTVNAVEDGIVGKELLAINETEVTIDAGKDGLKANSKEENGNIIIKSGTFNIVAANDCIQAERTLQIEDGLFNLTAGGGFVEVLNEITIGEGSSAQSVTDTLIESMKTIKGLDIYLTGGQFNLSAYEDAINADHTLHITSGEYTILAGDDGVKAENSVIIDGGKITVVNGYEGIEGAHITINGGEISVNVLDDAMNASEETSELVINRGDIYLKSQGDGIDSNGNLKVTGGKIVLDINPIHVGGDGAVDVSGTAEIAPQTVFDAAGNEITGTTTMGKPGGGMRPEGMKPDGAVRPEGMKPDGAVRPEGMKPDGAVRPEGMGPNGSMRPEGMQPNGAIPLEHIKQKGDMLQEQTP